MKRWLLGIVLATAACGGAAAPTGGAADANKNGTGSTTESVQAVPSATAPGGAQPVPDGMCTSEKPACSGNEPEKGKIGAGGPSVTGKLPPEVIARTIRASIAQVSLCYERGVHKDPGLKGTVRIKFTIVADGKVTSAQDDGSQLASAEVIECVRSAVQKMTFPAPEGGPVTVVYPFSFEPKP